MTDRELKQHVQNALDWEPTIDATDIGLSVEKGVVTLRGNVRSYAEELYAERAALRVSGVKGVANDLTVRVADGYARTDTEIAQAALTALKWNAALLPDRVTVTVTNGWVALRGTLEWQYEKDAAERAVRKLAAVRGVINEIIVKPRVKTTDAQAKIEAAF